ncbi:hypothetical protein Desaci_1062 [Desulfosporosinus acidiphilus SJ4]|uniref:Tetratricopeptide repeat protein n=1 Tax=Desulfosporosinus acidiphilus (strain DSM 22704 / JCM 16185 / SJ4) TaxID=646529 RepID=I4D2S7_DESAJ|nr:hypothetical protein [Desulfosporosinus acidiphilus]AFM40101.1 hypothetical protein Desaci_1062 [Desulfosporosinus acidiphilus SJ4]
MHIGHNHDDIDHESLALRHYGEGIYQESLGNLAEALNEYMMANVLDPKLVVVQNKLDSLREKLCL